jgi:hypothetical protein
VKQTQIQRKTPLHRGTKDLSQGKPLTRVTPLKASGKPLARKTKLRSNAELRTATPPDRKTALEPSEKPRKRKRYTGPPRPVVDKLKARSGGLCEYCGVRRATEAHHRLGRKAGGTKRPWINKLSNLVHLDRLCHARITNTNGRRAEYEEAGFLLRESLKPWKTPVDHARLGRVLLLDNGDTTPAPRKAA